MSSIKDTLSDGSDFQADYLRHIINALPNIVYIVDKDCRIINANKKFLEWVSCPEGESLSENLYKTLVANAHWSEERAQILKRDDIAALVRAQPQYSVAEPPVVAEDGNIIYYLANRVPIFDDKGQLYQMIVVLTDISGYKRMKDQFENSKIQKMHDQDKPKQAAATMREKDLPPKILMIEDNEIAQRATQELLLQLDCKVDVASTGDLATMMFKPGKYDLVFMDIGLGETSGYAVSKRIRQMEGTSGHHVPIIALTSYQADIVKDDCTDYFMEGAITKPLSNEQAKQIIQHYVYHVDVPVNGMKAKE